MGTFDHTWSISVFCTCLVLLKGKQKLYLHMYFSNSFVLALFCNTSILKSLTMTMVSFTCKCSNALERTFSCMGSGIEIKYFNFRSIEQYFCKHHLNIVFFEMHMVQNCYMFFYQYHHPMFNGTQYAIVI